MKTYGYLSIATSAIALGGLACGGSEPRTGSGGNAVTIAVAPLDGSGIGVACFDLKVETALGTFWEKGDPENSFFDDDLDTICSDDHGNGGGGSVRWVGACDGQDAADTNGTLTDGVQNTVTIWFDGVYNDDKTEVSANVYDPCGTAGCSIEFDCDPNADTRADFNFTVIQDAEVGFFDIAVRFDNIYCSAKYDDCYTDDQPVQLFSGADGTPHQTGVFALACTGPLGTDVNLHYGNLAVVCQGVTYPIDPTVSRVTDAEAEPSGSPLTYNAYRDTTSFACDGGTCNGLYWNLAFDLTDLPDLGSCTLEFSATATNGEGVFVNGLPANAGSSYPYIDVDVTMSGDEQSCQQNPLNGEESGVLTGYHGDLTNNAVAMCSTYDGATAAATGNAACDELPSAAPAGNVLRAYTGICNDPNNPNGDWHHVDNPIECPSGTRCVMAGSYYYGTCVPDEVETCRENTGCGAATVELIFSRQTTGLAITIPAGTDVSSATDADNDPLTGYQYNFRLLDDVVFLTSTTSAVGHAVLQREPQMDPTDLGNVAAGTLTVIGTSGTAGDYGDINVINENDASGGATDTVCVIGYGTQIGTCVEKGHPQACDPGNSDPHCPAGSYCERGETTNAGQCRAKAPEGAACSGSMAQNGVEQCQPGLQCSYEPGSGDWTFTCRRPGIDGAECDADMDTNYPFCGPGLYCRLESQDFATCSPRKTLGEACFLPQNGDDRRFLGNCAENLTCTLTFANENNEDERRCGANPLLDHGEPCWTEGEEALRKCKGHCNVDVNPNPFQHLQADGVCAADVGEGAPCHAGEFGDDDFNGYCRRGLYCNEEGLGQNMSGYGTCLPVDGIGSICNLTSTPFPDTMCADDQLCGFKSGSVGFMNGEEGYCVDRGCGNNVNEPEFGFEAEGELGILVVWAGTCSVATSTYCNVDADCPGAETCGQDGPHEEMIESAGAIGIDQGGGAPHGLQVGDLLTVQFDGATPPNDGWQVRAVSEIVNAWTIKLEGGIPAGTSEVEILGGGREQCDDGRNNCDDVVNGQPVCQCSTLCTNN